MTVAELLANAQHAIQLTLQLSKQDASLEAQLLLQSILDVNRAWLIAHADDALNPDTNKTFQVMLQRRLNGEPIAYILGYREFYGLHLKVTPETLIPRPDTETLVEAGLAKTARDQAAKILDLGTGTGAVALAMAKHCPLAKITAVDASENALKVAQKNTQTLNIHNVNFVLSNWFDALQNQTFDVILSNPPYIEEADPHLSQGDLRFEPISALASGVDGLDDIRRIAQQAPAYLNRNGWLMLEHGYNQASSVAALLKEAGFVDIDHTKDIASIERVTLGRIG